jgi:hypothetical protein
MKRITLLFVLLTVSTFNYLTAQTTSPSPYCVADFDDDPFNVPDAINSVSFGTLMNVTDAQYAAPHYVFYNNVTVPNLIKGSAYTLTMTFDVNGGCGYGVWIDYNQNNTFEPSEKVSGSPMGAPLEISSNTTVTESITIPMTAMTGTTRMRVRIVEDDNYTFGANGYAIQPCNASASAMDIMDWGETEDYTINITSTVGLNESKELSKLIIYPNPVTTSLKLNTDVSSFMTFKVVNLTGQVVHSGAVNDFDKMINVSTLLDGIYFLQLYMDNGMIGQEKFVKVNN